MLRFTILLLAVALPATWAQIDLELDPEPLVYTPMMIIDQGKLRGRVRHSEETHKVHFYSGIRYGVAKRFEKPVPAPKWEGVLDAISPKAACPQSGLPVTTQPVHYSENVTNTWLSSEDCLYLNVWTPTNVPTAQLGKLPVMFWIHGGTYKTGTIFSLAYDARHIAALAQVIVVTVNYRLGPFGFLSGDSAQHPGNLGLYDMVLALRWVQSNIIHFGGDPNQITIDGESAGSFAVGALVLSPLTKGLFHRAILQSGAPNSYLGSEEKSKSLAKTKAFADKLNCTAEKYDQMIGCLQTRSAESLLKAAANDVANNEEFIPIYPESLLPQVPEKELLNFDRELDLLFGVTANEGATFVRALLPSVDTNGRGDLNKVKQALLLLSLVFKLSNPAQVAEFYTRHLTANSSSLEMENALADAFGDFHLVCPTMLFGEAVARQHHKHGKHHNYYSYRFMETINMNILGCKPEYGVCHGVDVIYLFGHPLTFWNKTIDYRGQRIHISLEEYMMSKEVIRKWGQFIRTGNMGQMDHVPWTPAIDIGGKDSSPKNITVSFMELKMGHFKMNHEFYRESCDHFWRPRLFPDEHRW